MTDDEARRKLATLSAEASRLHRENEAMRSAIAKAVDIARDEKRRAATRMGLMVRILVTEAFKR